MSKTTIDERATEIRRKLCASQGVTEHGKPLESAVVNRAADGRPKLFGIPIGRERK